jgi:hypothetical protein
LGSNRCLKIGEVSYATTARKRHMTDIGTDSVMIAKRRHAHWRRALQIGRDPVALVLCANAK